MQKLGEEGSMDEKQVNYRVGMVWENIELIRRAPNAPLGSEIKKNQAILLQSE
jgi:hypothetical protein